MTRCGLRILEDKMLDPAGKLICLILVGLHDPRTHQATVSDQRLAALFGIPRPNMFAHIKRLVATGAVHKTRHFTTGRRPTKNSYIVQTCILKTLQ